MIHVLSRKFGLFSIVLPLLIPPVVFTYSAFAAGMSGSETIGALVDQYGASRQNLWVCGFLGWFPILLLFVVFWIARRVKGKDERLSALAWGGLIPIIAVLVWVNFEYWPSFLPARTFLGFPHGLEFVIGPGIFAPVGMVTGMVIGWLAMGKST